MRMKHSREGEAHIKLKEKAKTFLDNLGFDEIFEEYPTGVRYCGNYFSRPKEAHVDVVGFKDIKGTISRYVSIFPSYYVDFPASWSRMAIVECGDTPDGKLGTLSRHFDEVYHLPYGRKMERVKRIPKTRWWEI